MRVQGEQMMSVVGSDEPIMEPFETENPQEAVELAVAAYLGYGYIEIAEAPNMEYSAISEDLKYRVTFSEDGTWNCRERQFCSCGTELSPNWSTCGRLGCY
jgi:hypothetical protein